MSVYLPPIAIYLGGVVTVAVPWLLKEWLFPDLLDRRKQERADRLQREAEARAHEREDGPIRERIGSTIRSLCDSLYRGAFLHGEFTYEEWQHWHKELALLVESPEGGRALKGHYRIFADALKHDSLSNRIQEQQGEQSPKSWLPIQRVKAHAMRAEHWAYLEQVAAGVLGDWVAPLRAIGFEEDATRYEKAAEKHEKLALEKLSRLPPF